MKCISDLAARNFALAQEATTLTAAADEAGTDASARDLDRGRLVINKLLSLLDGLDKNVIKAQLKAFISSRVAVGQLESRKLKVPLEETLHMPPSV